MKEIFANPFYYLALFFVGGLIFLVLFAGRRRKTGTGGSPTPVAPGSKETPVSDGMTDPKKHKL